MELFHKFARNGFSVVSHADGNKSDLRYVLNCNIDEPDEIDYYLGRRFLGERCPQCTDETLCCKCKGERMLYQMHYSGWKDNSRLYYNRNFCQNEESVQRFPPIYYDKIPKCVEHVVKYISQCFQKGFIITNYDTKKHLKFLKVKFGNVKKEMGIIDIGDHLNRILVFDVASGVIANIRVSSSDSKDDLERELILSREDLKLFIFLNKSSLKNSGVSLIATVALQNEMKKEYVGGLVYSTECSECESVLLTNETMLSVQSCKRWWDHVIIQEANCLKRLGSLLSSTEMLKECSVNIVSQICSYMAGNSYTNIYSYMPTLSNNINDQVSSTMLNPTQIMALYHDSKKKILIGNFGSGKTIIGNLMIQRLCQPNENRTFVYYICHDPRSFLHLYIRDFTDKLMKKNKDTGSSVEVRSMNILEISELLNLTYLTPVSVLIKVLAEKHLGGTVHIIIDEYDGEQLSETEAESIKEVLNDLEDSHVVFMAQSLEKHRMFTSKGQQINHARYQYEKTGMQIIKLGKTMRTTTRIYEVLKATQSSITKKANKRYHQKESTIEKVSLLQEKELNEERDDKIYETFGNVLEESGSKSIETTQYIDTPSESEEVRNDVGVVDDESSKLVDVVDKKQEGEVDVQLLEDFDYVQQPLKRDIDEKKATVTTICYAEDSGIGNNIVGSKPVLYYPPNLKKRYQQHTSLSVLMLTITMDHLLSKGRYDGEIDRPPVIICNNEKQLEMVTKSLEVLNKNIVVYSSFSSNFDLKSKSSMYTALCEKDLIMVTDNRCFRGLEHENVVILIDPSDQCTRQYVAESIARSTSKLSLIYLRNEDHRSSKGRILFSLNDKIKSKADLDKIMDMLLKKELILSEEVCAPTDEAVNALLEKCKRLEMVDSPVVSQDLSSYFRRMER